MAANPHGVSLHLEIPAVATCLRVQRLILDQRLHTFVSGKVAESCREVRKQLEERVQPSSDPPERTDPLLGQLVLEHGERVGGSSVHRQGVSGGSADAADAAQQGVDSVAVPAQHGDILVRRIETAMLETEPRVVTTLEELDGGGRLARITIDNQSRLNVVSSPIIRQLTDAVRGLYGDTDLRLVVVTGAGDRAFVGGADVRELVELDVDSAYPYITRLHLACASLRKMPVPVIARIDGYCLGGGLEIAISCDLRVASATSTFGMPEVRLGIPSVIEAAVLRRLVGPGKTRQLVYTGEPIDATEALGCGLVDRVVPPSELDAAVDAWARAIGSAGPRAIRLQKALVRRWDDIPLDHAIQAGMRSFITAFATDEPHRLMRRFLDKKLD